MASRARQVKLLIVALLVATPVLFVLFWQAKDKRAVRKYKQQLVAGGEKLTIGQLVPRPAEPESNRASSIFRLYSKRPPAGILSTNSPRAMHMVAPGKAAVGWAQTAIVDGTRTNLWDEELTTFSQQEPASEWVDQMIAHPALDFHLDYRSGFDLLLPHLAPLKYLAQSLSMGTVFDLHRHDPAGAVQKVRAILAEAYAMSDERLIISQLVRMAIAQIGIAAIWEVLQSPEVTDDQLAAIQGDLARLDFVTPYLDALQMERAMQQHLLDRMRNSSAEFRRLTSGATFSAPGSSNLLERAGNFVLFKSRETAWTFSWSYPDELRALKGFQVLIEGLRSEQAGSSFMEVTNRTGKRLGELGIDQLPVEDASGLFGSGEFDVRTFLSRSVVSLRHGIDRTEACDIARNLVVTAIALQRYRLRHGQFPSDLAALSREIIETVPRDPVDGKSLRYHLNAEGAFVLYSIGPDGVDDGGDPKCPTDPKTYGWQRGRDWVWPRPASVNEVDTYNHELKK